MELHTIANSNGANRRKKRVGSGEGSGLGKTCGRGQKGAKSRSGYSVRPGFEGGQMPLYLKLPHRGFSNYKHRTNYAELSIRDLSKFDEKVTITREYLIEKGFIAKSVKRVKLLANGETDKAYTIEVAKASAGAIAKIEKAGGKVTLLSEKTEAEPEPEKAESEEK